MKKNKMNLSFSAISENESFARMAVASFVLPLDPGIDVICDIKTAVSEAVTNAIIHGYSESEGDVFVECSIDNGLLKVEVCDEGKGIKDVPLAMEPMYTESNDAERSGMGFTVMSAFMDSIKVESEEGKGTKVYMTKRICAK